MLDKLFLEITQLQICWPIQLKKDVVFDIKFLFIRHFKVTSNYCFIVNDVKGKNYSRNVELFMKYSNFK